MRVSRERGAPACSVNINLSAQWSYHERTRKKFRCSTDGGCIVIPRAPAQQRPFVQRSVAGCCCCCCHRRCRGAMNESVQYWRRKRKNNDIISNHHAGWVYGRRNCLPPSPLLTREVRFAILTRSLIVICVSRFRRIHTAMSWPSWQYHAIGNTTLSKGTQRPRKQ